MVVPDTNLLYKDVGGEQKLCISYSQLDTFMQCPYRWYETYILGKRSKKKSEATSYGTCIHQTLEHFFKTGRSLTRQQMCDTFCYYAKQEEIPFDSLWNQIKGYKDSMSIINWISDIYERRNGEFVKEKKDLNRAEYMLRMCNVAGVEEDFKLKYKLPRPVNINGKVEAEVYFVGSLDLHLEKNGYHVVIDWKSDGDGYYSEKRLNKSLQHPIYAMYVLRQYGVLPGSSLYIHTRSGIHEEIKVDPEKIRKAVGIINSTLSHMYSFATKQAEDMKKKDESFDQFELVKIANPSPLCYWCPFSRTSGDKSCENSSSYVKRKK